MNEIAASHMGREDEEKMKAETQLSFKRDEKKINLELPRLHESSARFSNLRSDGFSPIISFSFESRENG